MNIENPTQTVCDQPQFQPLPTPRHTVCRRCGCQGIFMIGLYRCDHPDLAARRCGGVLTNVLSNGLTNGFSKEMK